MTASRIGSTGPYFRSVLCGVSLMTTPDNGYSSLNKTPIIDAQGVRCRLAVPPE